MLSNLKQIQEVQVCIYGIIERCCRSNGFEVTGRLGELTVSIMTHKVLYSDFFLKKNPLEAQRPWDKRDTSQPPPRMCPSQHACCSSISCVWSPAHRRFPDGNRRTNQRAAFSCRTKTKQFTSRCQQAFHATLANNQDRNREKRAPFFLPVTKRKRRRERHTLPRTMTKGEII